MASNLKELPSVDQILADPASVELLKTHRPEFVVDQIRASLQHIRQRLLHSNSDLSRQPERSLTREELLTEVRRSLVERVRLGEVASLHKVINATGVILHTGLGRAPLAPAALQAALEVGGNYCNLELDLESGKRGSRLDHVEQLICDASGGAVVGAEAAGVVNNNAGAVALILNTLASQRQVLISRGELVEIGGSFRMPDIISSSGAQIREVGTTNRTHAKDYADAIDAETALILVVHPSNYRVRGFTSGVDLGELVALSRSRQIPLVYDLGGGVLEALEQWQLPHEPVVRDGLEVGVDLVSFSGDKVLGGPQCGIIVGRETLVSRVVANPLMRALRCDKLILAALEATLKMYRLDLHQLRAVHPVLRMMTESLECVEARARKLMAGLSEVAVSRLRPTVQESSAQAGSGALPLEELHSRALVLQPTWCDSEGLAQQLRLADPSVLGRIHKDRVVLDVRTVSDAEVASMGEALEAVAVGENQ